MLFQSCLAWIINNFVVVLYLCILAVDAVTDQYAIKKISFSIKE